MRHVLVLLLLALAGCGDIELDVVFDIPEEYERAVDRVVLHVLTPPAGAPFTCDELAFGWIGEETITESTVTTVELDGRTPLGDLDRRATKLFLAEGLSIDGLPAVVGCEAIGALDESAAVSIEAEPAPIANLVVTPGGHETFEGLVLSCRDVIGRPLAGIAFHWDLVAAGDDPVLDEGDGETTGVDTALAVSQPTHAGPATLSVSVRWQRTQRSPLSILVPPTRLWSRDSAEPAIEALVAGRIAVGGIGGIATLTATATELRVHTYHFDPAAPPTVGFPFISPPPVPRPVQDVDRGFLLTVDHGDRDNLVVVGNELAGTAAWFDIPPSGPPDRRRVLGANRAIAASSVPSCGREPRVLVSFGPQDIRAFRPNTDNDTEHGFCHLSNADRFLASGCMEHEEVLYQALFLQENLFNLLAIADVDRAHMSFLAPGDYPAAFSPPTSQALRLFLPEGSPSGQTLDRLDILAIRQNDGIVVLNRTGTDALGGIPLSIANGDFDGDGNTDVAAVVLGRAVGEPTPGPRLLMVLGKDLRGERITAWRLLPDFSSPALAVADIDANGYDDVVLAETDPGFDTHIEVMPMGPL